METVSLLGSHSFFSFLKSFHGKENKGAQGKCTGYI